ncbi:two component transcriptional regulator, LuxR family [Rhodovulum sp. ES.010]|uniref:response regulator n=1 Tax=Rhodovulum sp. ES.010 TaxID=1882821 RepID=UPI00092C027D|nr:response regulator transcription factor [Rhodovulum sp. ES.010]SIO47398.1 two component transcriptional regulator, LuxR family [Rhodovulum sp. ES.010]
MNHDSVEPSANRVRSILVIDDHPLYGDALATALARVFDACEIRTATNLADGLAQLGPGFAPDLVMLDLKLPDVTGLSGFFRVRERIPDVPMLVISALTSPDLVAALMEGGAAGFIAKDADTGELRAALTEVTAGRRYLPPAFRESCAAGAAPARMPTVQEVSQRIAELTPQQARIMRLICAGKPNKQIAHELSLAEATVKAHITALLRRLGVQNRTQAAVLVESVNLDMGGAFAEPDARAFLGQ